MAKIRLKSDNITPLGGIFSIFKKFSSSGLRKTIDSHLGRRGKTDACLNSSIGFKNTGTSLPARKSAERVGLTPKSYAVCGIEALLNYPLHLTERHRPEIIIVHADVVLCLKESV